MKYAIIIPDGCADDPQPALDGRTPLQRAHVPAMDAVAQQGCVGQSNNVPDHLTAGSDVANMNLFGYDTDRYFTGRAPLEAAAQGIELGPADWAIRCNLVSISDQVMRDFTAGHISTDEARQLLTDLQTELSDPTLDFRAGVSYRNLLIYRGATQPAPFSAETQGTPPHDLTDQSIVDDYPRGPGCDWLSQWMQRSAEVFADHPVNVARVAAGRLPATHIWLWGLGRTPQLPAFVDRFGLRGRMITAVDLLRGLALLMGWRCIEVPGATGYTDTDYGAKGRYAAQALADPEVDIVCVHVEATDEASHEGDADAKIKALEEIDRHIVAPVHQALADQGDYRILVSPDHPTFLRTKTHSHGYVPWAMCGTGVDRDSSQTYDEVVASASRWTFDKGHELMAFFIGKEAVCP